MIFDPKIFQLNVIHICTKILSGTALATSFQVKTFQVITFLLSQIVPMEHNYIQTHYCHFLISKTATYLRIWACCFS